MKCLCDCGHEAYIKLLYLKRKSGRKSCGCSYKNPKTHGLRYTREHNIWTGMKQRCLDKNSSNYKNYGGRGITICDEWRDDFKVFYDWAHENGYSNELTIDRVDNDMGYFPENCRWVTYKEQILNQRPKPSCRTISVNGKRIYLQDLSRSHGILSQTLRKRLDIYKWSAGDLLNKSGEKRKFKTRLELFS